MAVKTGPGPFVASIACPPGPLVGGTSLRVTDQHLTLSPSLIPHTACRLSQQQEDLEKKMSTEEAVIKQSADKLDGLQPALDSLQKATVPLQEMLGLPLDKTREEESLALLLPESVPEKMFS